MNFTTKNNRFRTNTEKGFAHGDNPARGSVLPQAIKGGKGEYSLWMEHALDNETECFWLVWYDPAGEMATLTSAVFWREDISRMMAALTYLSAFEV